MGVGEPLGHGLGQQGQRRDQHQGAFRFEAFGDSQRHECLAGAARHDQLGAPVQIVDDISDGFLLVGPWRLGFPGFAGSEAPRMGRPHHRCGFQVTQEQFVDRDHVVLLADHPSGVRAEPVGGGDQ